MAIWLVRHGETAWSVSGQHTGTTDIPLTRTGELQALALGKLLAGRTFDRAISSPLGRARRTAELAGFADAGVDDRLCEVDYGELEGLTTEQIWERTPGWELFRDGCPGGESPAGISARADEVLEHLRGLGGTTLLFGHGHRFRALGARFLGQPIGAATNLRLDAGSLSILADGRDGPSLVLWNRAVPTTAVVVADLAASIARAEREAGGAD
jgi:probable phosphoglycerate mutase